MKLRCPLLAGAGIGACAVPVVLACAGPALARVPSVYFRVEGTHRTIVAAGKVTAPAHGWVTKGGTPRGECPADSAAGALSVATHGRWTGTYDKGLGIEVTSIRGTTAQYAKGTWWALYVDKHLSSKGLCDVKPAPDQSLLIAQVPARGRTPLPLVLKTPRRAVVGAPFQAHTYAFPGKGDRTAAVRHVHFTITRAGRPGHVIVQHTNRRGLTGLIASRPGTLRIVASAKGYIRSAPRTVIVR